MKLFIIPSISVIWEARNIVTTFTTKFLQYFPVDYEENKNDHSNSKKSNSFWNWHLKTFDHEKAGKS